MNYALGALAIMVAARQAVYKDGVSIVMESSSEGGVDSLRLIGYLGNRMVYKDRITCKDGRLNTERALADILAGLDASLDIEDPFNGKYMDFGYDDFEIDAMRAHAPDPEENREPEDNADLITD